MLYNQAFVKNVNRFMLTLLMVSFVPNALSNIKREVQTDQIKVTKTEKIQIQEQEKEQIKSEEKKI